MNTFGRNLRKLRLEKKLSVEKLAWLACIPKVDVFYYEADCWLPNKAELEALAWALDVDAEKLIPTCKRTEPFGKFVKRRRKELGLTQMKLAEKAGLSQLVIWSLEHGHTQTPRESTREKLLSILEE